MRNWLDGTIRRMLLVVGVAALGCGTLLLSVSCVRRIAPSSLVLFAAASTTEAVKEITLAYEKATGTKVYCNFASSGALAQQIQAGADADLFLSANRDWVAALEQKGLTDRVTELAANRLVTIVPSRSGPALDGPEDLSSPQVGRISIGEPNSVPAGIYARKALEKLGLWEKLEPRLVFSFDVRQALAYVERGEVDAGLVYATDAAISPDVRVAFSFDPALTDPIRYPLVLLVDARPQAADLFRFFSSSEATQVLRKYGFEPLDSPSPE